MPAGCDSREPRPQRVCEVSPTRAAHGRLRIGAFGANLDGFSGIPRNIIAALRVLGQEVVELRPRHYAPPLARRLVKRAARSLGREYLWEKAPARCRFLSRELDRLAAAHQPDVILVFGSESCAFSTTGVPLFGYGDSVFGSRLDFYDDQRSERISAASIREGIDVQQRALDRLAKMFISSEWAWQRAVSKFGYSCVPGKHEVVLIGANLDDPGTPPEFPGRGVRFVWIGGDWDRKGGDFAVEIVGRLRHRGLDASLDVAGVTATPAHAPWIRVHGRIEGTSAQRSLYASARALLLPTRADLTPVAIAEAAAFGRPAVATPVGGIPEMIQDGETGLLLEKDVELWTDALASAPFERMGRAARTAFDDTLNWESVCGRMLASMNANLLRP